MRGIVWFRADLRVCDNKALSKASEQCHDGLLAVFYLTPETWLRHDVSGNKVGFILKQLVCLQKDLDALNIKLQIIERPSFKDSANDIKKLMFEHKIDALYFNKQYEYDELKRDSQLTSSLKNQGKNVFSYHDQVIMPPGAILSAKGQPYSVFTPFKKTWLNLAGNNDDVMLYSKTKKQKNPIAKETEVPVQLAGFLPKIDLQAWAVGEANAQQALEKFLKLHLGEYKEKRDYPSIDGTSRLSPYLAIGMLSPRQCLQAALKIRSAKNNEGLDTWVSELIWREFYKHVAFNFPHVCMGHAFHRIYDKMPWGENQAWQKAWYEGQTGFPIVDAAMRQLRNTGWMHNRLRMITAMFFSKLMGQDWHLGEKFFMQNLLDGDFSANNGGWQWSASTGTDSVPYFRLFNPWQQSKNFDPAGDFIRKYCPELRGFDAKSIHNPYQYNSVMAEKSSYPRPILDYTQRRKIVLEKYKTFNQKD